MVAPFVDPTSHQTLYHILETSPLAYEPSIVLSTMYPTNHPASLELPAVTLAYENDSVTVLAFSHQISHQRYSPLEDTAPVVYALVIDVSDAYHINHHT